MYVPENGHIDLIVDQQVMHSMTQGSIKGFVDRGYISIATYDGSTDILPLADKVAKSAGEGVPARFESYSKKDLTGLSSHAELVIDDLKIT